MLRDDAEDFDDVIRGDACELERTDSDTVDVLSDSTREVDDLLVGIGDLGAVAEYAAGGGQRGLCFEDRLAEFDFAADGLVEESAERTP